MICMCFRQLERRRYRYMDLRHLWFETWHKNNRLSPNAHAQHDGLKSGLNHSHILSMIMSGMYVRQLERRIIDYHHLSWYTVMWLACDSWEEERTTESAIFWSQSDKHIGTPASGSRSQTTARRLAALYTWLTIAQKLTSDCKMMLSHYPCRDATFFATHCGLTHKLIR